jgi:hypothetical protein
MIITDLVILAEDALHVAVTEEDVTNAAGTREDRLLAMMGADGGDGDAVVAVAETQLRGSSISITLPRATVAVF